MGQALDNVVRLTLFALGFAAFYGALQLLPYRRRRLPGWPGKGGGGWLNAPPAWLGGLLAGDWRGERLAAREQLLAGAGVAVHPLRYLIAKRAAIVAVLSAAVLLYALGGSFPPQWFALRIYGWLAVAIALLLLLADRVLLETARKQRSRRIVQEIYVLSHQLLYYHGSRLNLHAKLMRCVPRARTIRTELALMLNEWYHDPGEAIAAFKRRLGTDEAISFGETLDALRRNEADAYYELLRQRIHDYKGKLDLLKESRKETTSYLLFVVAGLPITNTFRLFIYPWVEEGQKLFHSLNG